MIVSGADLYGSEAERLVGTKTQSTSVAASGSVGNVMKADTNASFSWLAFILILIFIRVLEQYSPTF